MSSRSSAASVPTVSCESGVCRVQGTLDFTTANSVLTEVCELIAVNPKLEIDLGGVTNSNSVGLALMLEWLASARREAHSVTFRQIPDSLRQLAGVCQVDSLI